MNEPHSHPVDRREFLQAGMVATAATTGLVAGDAAAQEPKAGEVRSPSCRNGSWARRVSR